MQQPTTGGTGQAGYYGAYAAGQPTWDAAAWAAYYSNWQQPQAAHAPAAQQTAPTATATATAGQTYDPAAAWAAYYQNYGMAGYGYPAQAHTAAPATATHPTTTTATATRPAPAPAAAPKASAEIYDPTKPTVDYATPSAPAYMSTQKVSFQMRPSNPSYAKYECSGNQAEPKPAAAEAKKPAGNGNSGWPPSLRAYVERAFASCTNDQQKNEMEAILKRLITKIMSEGTMWTTDWDKEPLPKPGADQQKRPADFGPGGAQDASRKKLKKDEEPIQKKAKGKLKLMSLKEDTNDRRALRSARFAESDAPSPRRKRHMPPPTVALDFDEQDWESMVIKGTCTVLEKEYLRLTSAPDPSTVRPEPVLKQALKALLERYSTKPDYIYTCNQLKAIRQDLTVQHIKNGFAIKVYEKHARLALQNGDFYEFNACQSRLIELYEEVEGQGHFAEFTAYRIFHALYANSVTEVAYVMADLSPKERLLRPVVHALEVRAALAMSNYHRFFKLYKQTPNMGSFLLDRFIDKVRISALKVICKAYRPTIDAGWLISELSFSTKKKGLAFLRENGATFEGGQSEIDTRTFYTALIAKHPDRPDS